MMCAHGETLSTFPCSSQFFTFHFFAKKNHLLRSSSLSHDTPGRRVLHGAAMSDPARVEALVHAECVATGGGGGGGSGRGRRGSGRGGEDDGGGGGGGKNCASSANKRPRPAGMYAVSRAVQRAAPRANPLSKNTTRGAVAGGSGGTPAASAEARQQHAYDAPPPPPHEALEKLIFEQNQKRAAVPNAANAGFVTSTSYSQGYSQAPSELLVELEVGLYKFRFS
jgi:hypothetical protein